MDSTSFAVMTMRDLRRKPGSARSSRKSRPVQEPLTPYQRQLAEQFLPLARAIARPLKLMYPHWKDDFESAACLALVEAARSFDPDRKIRFATFARFRIRGALHDVGRTLRTGGWDPGRDENPQMFRITSLNEVPGTPLTREYGVGAEVEAADNFEQWLRRLPKRNADVCRYCYVENKTQSEIALLLGISQSEVTRLHRQAIDLLAEPYAGKSKRRSAASQMPATATAVDFSLTEAALLV